MKGDNGFVLQETKLDSCPVLVCESCGGIIRDYRMAWVMWDATKVREGDIIRPVVLCKGNQCVTKSPYIGYASMEMRDYLVNLSRNLGIRTGDDLREALQFAEMMDSI